MKVADTPRCGPRARGQHRFRDVDADAWRRGSEPARDRHRRASRPAANVEQLIGTTRGCQIGEPIGERLEQLIEHRAVATHA